MIGALEKTLLLLDAVDGLRLEHETRFRQAGGRLAPSDGGGSHSPLSRSLVLPSGLAKKDIVPALETVRACLAGFDGIAESEERILRSIILHAGLPPRKMNEPSPEEKAAREYGTPEVHGYA
jgi:hypothetical protein